MVRISIIELGLWLWWRLVCDWVDNNDKRTNNKFIIIGDNKVYEINQGTRHVPASSSSLLRQQDTDSKERPGKPQRKHNSFAYAANMITTTSTASCIDRNAIEEKKKYSNRFAFYRLFTCSDTFQFACLHCGGTTWKTFFKENLHGKVQEFVFDWDLGIIVGTHSWEPFSIL